MSQREDTDENQHGPEPSDKEIERPPRSYYYDDATGYETYDPKSEHDDEEADEAPS